MNTEIKPARTRVTPSFAKWEASAKFVGEPGYIKSDKFDRAVAWALGFGVVVILGTTAWDWYVK